MGNNPSKKPKNPPQPIPTTNTTSNNYNTSTTTSSHPVTTTNSYNTTTTTNNTTNGSTSIASTTATTNTTSSNKKSGNDLESLFEKYQQLDEHVGESGEAADYVGGDGIIQFAQDVGIDPMDVIVLMLLYKLDSKTQYHITRKEWMTGFAQNSINNLQDMKSKIPQLRSQINSSTKTFKQFYNWCFNYVKETDQKGMAVEVACQTWKVVLAGKFGLLDDWCNFMQVEVAKAVQKDTWDLFLDFVNQVGDNLNQFDEGGAWPVAVDEFVAWMKEGKNVAVRERLQKEQAEQQEEEE